MAFRGDLPGAVSRRDRLGGPAPGPLSACRSRHRPATRLVSATRLTERASSIAPALPDQDEEGSYGPTPIPRASTPVLDTSTTARRRRGHLPPVRSSGWHRDRRPLATRRPCSVPTGRRIERPHPCRVVAAALLRLRRQHGRQRVPVAHPRARVRAVEQQDGGPFHLRACSRPSVWTRFTRLLIANS